MIHEIVEQFRRILTVHSVSLHFPFLFVLHEGLLTCSHTTQPAWLSLNYTFIFSFVYPTPQWSRPNLVLNVDITHSNNQTHKHCISYKCCAELPQVGSNHGCSASVSPAILQVLMTYLFLAAARLVLRIVHRSDLWTDAPVELLRLNLKTIAQHTYTRSFIHHNSR